MEGGKKENGVQTTQEKWGFRCKAVEDFCQPYTVYYFIVEGRWGGERDTLTVERAQEFLE